MDEKNKITQEQENQEQQQNTQQPKITSMQALPSFGEWRYDVESEPPDSLKLEYPVFADKIDEALQQGKDRNEIRKHLALAEGIALTQYSQKEINNFLGRNDKSIAKVIDAIEQQKENSYVEMMKYDMPESKVRYICQTAKKTGFDPGVLLLYPEINKVAEEMAGQDRGILGTYGYAAPRNAYANLQLSNASMYKEAAQGIRKQMKDSNLMYQEGLRLWNAGLKTTLLPPPQEELIAKGRQAYQAKVDEYEAMAAEDAADAEAWRTSVRLPDSFLGLMAYNAIENAGFTAKSAVINAAAWGLGGLLSGGVGTAAKIFGFISSQIMSMDEAHREAGQTFTEAVNRGVDPDKAWEMAQFVKRGNMLFLPISNYGGNILLHGLDKLFEKKAAGIIGEGFFKDVKRRFIADWFPDIVLSAFPEGLEEITQEHLQMLALGDKIDYKRLWEAFKMGTLDAFIYNIFGTNVKNAFDYIAGERFYQKKHQRLKAIVNGERNIDNLNNMPVDDKSISQQAQKQLQDIVKTVLNLENGKVQTNDVIRNEDVVFLPKSQIDEKTAQALNVENEVMEDEEGNTVETPTEEDDMIAVRKETWDKFVTENPEQAQTLKQYATEGTQGVTAGEELERKYRDLTNVLSGNQELQEAVGKIKAEFIAAGRPENMAEIEATIAGVAAKGMNKHYGINLSQGTNISARSEENSNNTQQQQTQENNPNIVKIRTIRDTEVEARYRIIDADNLVTSNTEEGALNPLYPQELQPRQRNREASFEQINRIANKLDPELLGANRLVSDGAPVIGSDMVVESGNGRVMAIRQAYKNGMAENYRNWIYENAERFGLTKEDVANIQNPVLVRERLTEVDRAKFASEANEASTSQMSATEHAINDARNISPEILTLYDTEKSLSSNGAFINAFSRLIPQNERGDFLQQNGKISKSGLERIQNALIAKAYNDTGILNRLNEFTEDEIKNISNALVNAAPVMAFFENSGYDTALSLRDNIVEAVNTLAQIKQQGQTVAEYLSVPDMFNEISEESKTLLEFFDANKRSTKKITSLLSNYAQLAMQQPKTGQQVLFDDVIFDKSTILEQAMDYTTRGRQLSLFEGYNQTSQPDNVATLRDFKHAFDKLNKNGRTFIRIPDLRKELNWPREVFDSMLMKLRDEGIISLRVGDATLQTREEVENSFVDENGFRLGTVTWENNNIDLDNENFNVNLSQQKQQQQQISDPVAALASDILDMSKFDNGRENHFLPIDELRDAFNARGFDNEIFDFLIETLRDNGTIALRQSDASIAGAENAAKFFTDSNGFTFGTFSIENIDAIREAVQNATTNEEVTSQPTDTQLTAEEREIAKSKEFKQSLGFDWETGNLTAFDFVEPTQEELDRRAAKLSQILDENGEPKREVINDYMLAREMSKLYNKRKTDLINKRRELLDKYVYPEKFNVEKEIGILPVKRGKTVQKLKVLKVQDNETERLGRYNGVHLEIRNSKGDVIATYFPYNDKKLRFLRREEESMGKRNEWKRSFIDTFNKNLTQYLKDGEFTEKDGNEAFRERWNKRIKQAEQEGVESGFQDENEIHQEDFDDPELYKKVKAEEEAAKAVKYSKETPFGTIEIDNETGRPVLVKKEQTQQPIQTTEQGEQINARTTWPKNSNSVNAASLVEFFATANASSGFHELAHHVLRVLTDASMLDTATDELMQDVETIFKNAGVTRKDFINDKGNAREQAHEYFAKSFEAYLTEGIAPTKELQSTFDKIKAWLVEIYHNIKESLGIELNPEMREIFDKLLTTPEQMAEQQSLSDVNTLYQATDSELQSIQTELTELEKQFDAYKQQWNSQDWVAELAYKQGKKEGIANEKVKAKARLENQIEKLKQKQKLMQERQQERQRIRDKSKKLSKQIQKMAEAKNILWNRKQEIKQLLSTYDLSKAAKLSLRDVEFIHSQVQDLYTLGKQELAKKQLERRERLEKMRTELRQTMQKDYDKVPRGARRSAKDTDKEYNGAKGLRNRIIDWGMSRTMGAQRFFDFLDGNKKYKGAWVKTFVDKVNEAQDEKLVNKYRRTQELENKMAELGLTPKQITSSRKIDIPHYGTKDWTVDELMSVYAGMKNSKSKAAILLGNFAEAETIEQAQSWAAACVEALTEQEKELADFIIQEYEENFDRINEALINTYNEGMEHEVNYTPMRRIEVTTSNAGMIDPDAGDKLLASRKGSGMGDVEKGFSKSRINMRGKQSGIQLGLVSIWHSQVEIQEHAAAFGQLTRDLRAVLLSKGENGDVTLRQMLRQTRGKYAWDMIKNYYNIIANGDTIQAQNAFDGLARYMAKNMSIAYLCGNLGTVLKQFGSFPRVIPYAGVTSIFNNLTQAVTNWKNFSEECYNLDPQLRARKGDLFIQELRNDETTNQLYKNLLDWGSAPIGWMDRFASCVVFKSVYDANIKHGLSQNDAVREAQRAVLITQPTMNMKDKPLAWQQHGAARLMMLFTNDMAQTFGLTLYDMTQAIRRGDVPEALKIMTGVTLAAMLIKLLTSGLPDDDDDETFAQWVASAFTEQSINSIPLIGKELLTLWDSRRGYFKNNSAFVA
ncbi:MAG: hypothetical protein IJP41_08575, partial [Synergistaceae bacterium]|nr:hypothetical protein [Synergistaceae bacterium]